MAASASAARVEPTRLKMPTDAAEGTDEFTALESAMIAASTSGSVGGCALLSAAAAAAALLLLPLMSRGWPELSTTHAPLTAPLVLPPAGVSAAGCGSAEGAAAPVAG
jgi:hypothetical protein